MIRGCLYIGSAIWALYMAWTGNRELQPIEIVIGLFCLGMTFMYEGIGSIIGLWSKTND